MTSRPAPVRPRRRSALLLSAAALLGTSLVTAAHAAADTDSFLDPVGDVDCCPTPATDITSHRIGLDAQTLTSTVYLRSWSLPVLQGAHLETELDVTGDGAHDYVLVKDSGGQSARLRDASFGTLACPVSTDFSEADQSVSMSVASECLGSPQSVRVSQYVSGSGPTGFDTAPGFDVFTRPVSAGPVSGPDLPITPVYRFWSPRFGNAHFFTTNAQEAENLRYDWNWQDEGEAFSTYAAVGETCPGAITVHRFYSARFQTHFFTASSAEAHAIRTGDRNWTYEGVAYCALAAPETGTTALYRFWSARFAKHHFTANATEAHILRTSDPNWSFEGVAYHVLP